MTLRSFPSSSFRRFPNSEAAKMPTGCVTLKHVIPTMIARCIVAGAFIAVIAIPYWTFIGIM